VATDVGVDSQLVWEADSVLQWNIRFLDVIYRTSWCLVKCSIPDSVKRTRTQIQIFYFPANIHFYNGKVALLAGIISAIGYIGFTSSQVLAGAKLASATIDGLNIQTALIVMGVIVILPLED
jgi:hypothetical protein